MTHTQQTKMLWMTEIAGWGQTWWKVKSIFLLHFASVLYAILQRSPVACMNPCSCISFSLYKDMRVCLGTRSLEGGHGASPSYRQVTRYEEDRAEVLLQLSRTGVWGQHFWNGSSKASPEWRSRCNGGLQKGFAVNRHRRKAWEPQL